MSRWTMLRTVIISFTQQWHSVRTCCWIRSLATSTNPALNASIRGVVPQLSLSSHWYEPRDSNIRTVSVWPCSARHRTKPITIVALAKPLQPTVITHYITLMRSTVNMLQIYTHILHKIENWNWKINKIEIIITVIKKLIIIITVLFKICISYQENGMHTSVNVLLYCIFLPRCM